MGRKKLEKIKDFITDERFLEILKAGAGIFIAFTAPGALKLFENSFKDTLWKDYYPSSIERRAYKLWRKGYVEISEEKDKQIVKISEKGKVEILKYSIRGLEIKKTNSWDGKWRLVTFDVPEIKKRQREFFRNKLIELGFFRIQESVFIYPFPCEKEIMFLREILGIPHEVKIIRADKVENDEDLRKIFEI